MLLESTIQGDQPYGRPGAGLSEIKTNSAEVWLEFEFGLSWAIIFLRPIVYWFLKIT